MADGAVLVVSDARVNAKSGLDARRALVLHDQPLLINLIELTLNHGLFVVRAVRTLAGAESVLADWRPHLAVVDMDNDDAEDLLRRLGSSNTMWRSTTPVLGLTREGDLKTRLRAFSLGVDDIITVPFSPEELLARSIVISRRASGTDVSILPAMRIGEIEVDIVNRQVRTRESIARLSRIEQSILFVLASRAGRVVSRHEILDLIWGTDFVAESRLVDRHIRSLRIKLHDDFRRPRFIAAVPGQGYRFVPIYRDAGWASEAIERELPVA
jgi:DNA-binding response OmpR family regulator